MNPVYIPAASYAIGGVAFAALGGLAVLGWHGRRLGALFTVAVWVTALWSGVMALVAAWDLPVDVLIGAADGAKLALWTLFIVDLMRTRLGVVSSRGLWLWRAGLALLILALLAVPQLSLLSPQLLSPEAARKILWAMLATTATLGLSAVENLYRHTASDSRWGVKYLCIGLGGLFVYDFFLYAEGLLFGVLDLQLWSARGLVTALAMPLLAVSAARNPDWSLDLFVSRDVVYHTFSFVAAGIYLIFMAAAGYYLRQFGGEWGEVFQVTFLAGAVALLILMLFSGHLRAYVRVFLNKHFFNYRYDYRAEWLRFTSALAGCRHEREPAECVIKGVARIVESPGAALWLVGRQGRLEYRAHWNYPDIDAQAGIDPHGPFGEFLADTGWVLTFAAGQGLDEAHPAGRQLPEIPGWLARQPRLWLLVPLVEEGQLLGVVMLARPLAPVSLNWEVFDLLKTVARQTANYLSQRLAQEALAEARQFEGFNRLSAFILHDIKNLVAQQTIIVRNADKHRDKPGFIDDALKVMAHSTEKMSRLMRLLRTGGQPNFERLSLSRVLREVVEDLTSARPVPELEMPPGEVELIADPERLRASLRNIIQNAQQATAVEGSVRVVLEIEADRAIVTVTDTGCGMDEAFVRDLLFKPFASTKGDTGMGIGAYETREYLHALGGDIRVETEPGRGSRFTLDFPLPEREARPAATLARG